jgi:hypothetical protein
MMMCKLCDGLLEKKGNQAVEAFQRYYSKQERDRIINLLIDLNAIRRDALGELVAFNTDGTEVIYLSGLESK